MAKLILVRHGQSIWNAVNRFSGWVDVPLSHVGRQEATRAAKKINSYQIDVCFTSLLVRAIETIIMDLDRLSEEEVPNLELATGVPIVYDIDTSGKVTNKVILD